MPHRTLKFLPLAVALVSSSVYAESTNLEINRKDIKCMSIKTDQELVSTSANGLGCKFDLATGGCQNPTQADMKNTKQVQTFSLQIQVNPAASQSLTKFTSSIIGHWISLYGLDNGGVLFVKSDNTGNKKTKNPGFLISQSIVMSPLSGSFQFDIPKGLKKIKLQIAKQKYNPCN